MARRAPLQRLLTLSAVVLSALVAVNATQVMHRPDNYKEPPNAVVTSKNATTHTIAKREAHASEKTSFAYFTNWGIYGANFQPTDIKPSPLTHILYAFADTDASSGAIKFTDSYADQDKRFPTDSWNDVGNNLYGCLKQLYLLKLKQRNLKVLLSIGGWTYAQAGHFNFVTNPASRATFVSNAVTIIEDYGFDGIDIDYEYPANDAQGQGLADLITALRTAFDQLQSKKGDSTRYLITAAVAAGPANYANYKVAQMNAGLDYWNLMAYDYAGSWDTLSDNQANLYGGERTGFNTDNAVKWYIANGASANKINMGMPLYGRAFESTNGIGQPFSGVGPGTVEAGIYSYKVLPLAGSQIFEDNSIVASYSYDASKKELVSYDTPNMVKTKVSYINSKGLAGSMFWELSTDKTGSDSLVQTSANSLGALDSTQNHINFPNSKWDNIRNNMGGTVPPPTTTTSTPPTGPTGGNGKCGGVAAWSAATVYTGSQKATYNGHLWTASWWTQGDTPGGGAGVWVDGGAC
ncbi:glycosyl hydrolases family 18-domain-containing protein [Crepidotus variabilis]|uniref:chitinase n=1 Tax=Crepidotus variabilis TaxID=179855 RepID=A0A9P6JUC0_9AGAR|nr:glycosyl hydrolases family 18-domain-containing protein [Crepidotus variabilis]